MLLLQHRWFSFERYMCFLNLAEGAYLEQNEPFPLENYDSQEVFLSKTNSFFTGKRWA
jgi:hypothetical protein